MKRILLVFLAVIVILSAGCGPNEEQAAQARELVRGNWSGDVFTTEFAGLRFNMPSGWIAGTDEEIAELTGVAAGELSERGMKVSEKMLELTTIYDMAATNMQTGSSVMLMYENLSMHIGGNRLTETQYLEGVMELLEETGLGYTFTSGVEESSLAGETYMMLQGEISDFGISQSYHVKKIENFMVAIIVTIMDPGDSGILSNFARA